MLGDWAFQTGLSLPCLPWILQDELYTPARRRVEGDWFREFMPSGRHRPMSTEIERKFVLKGPAWKEGATGTYVRQGYLSTDQERTVRVRTIGEEGFLTIKGITTRATRDEYEFEIPLAEASEMLECLCELPLIEKTRYIIPIDELIWEVDEFHGENEGLVVAEVELRDEDQPVHLPLWIGEEVTEDPRYFNANLVDHPYSEW